MNIAADERSVTPVIGGILIVGIVVMLAAVVGVSFLGFADKLDELTGEMTYGDNLVDNPGFEEGTTGWAEFDKAGDRVGINDDRLVPGAGVDGSNGLRVKSDGGETDFVEQNLDAKLLADADYRICIAFRLESESGGQGWVGVQHADGGEGNHLVIWEVTDSEYQQECEYFTAEQELNNITAWAYTESDANITADNYVLQRTRYLVDQ